MTAFITTEYILVDHLRTHLTDPRGRDTNTDTESSTASTSQTDFSISVPTNNHLSAVTEVRVDSTPQSKWLDYYIDYQNKKIVFYTALSGGESVDIDYKYGQNWIFPARPSSDADNKVMKDATEWPRISVLVFGGNGDPLGKQGVETEDSSLVQIEARCKPKYRPQIDNYYYDSTRLAYYLVRQCKKYLRDQVEDMYPELYDVRPSRLPRTEDFDEVYQTDWATYEFTIKGLNTGEA